MEYISNTLGNLIEQTAFMNLTVGNLIMIAVACVFLYLAIRHGFEPLLLVPIAFGMLLVNIYPDIMLHAEDSAIGPRIAVCCSFPARKIDVGPSAPPIMEIAAAALSENPIAIAPKYAAKIPN